MKFKKDVDFTYLGYLHKACYANDAADEEHVNDMLRKFINFPYLKSVMPVLFVIDYSKKEYLFFTENIKTTLGYDAQEILEGGLTHGFSLFQKDYFKVLNEKAFPLTFSFLKRVQDNEKDNYVFSYNYQMKNSRGKWMDMLQKSTYITSKETGLPLFSLNTLFDISLFKRDNILVQSIEKINEKDKTREIIATNFFYPFEEDGRLTVREKTVLKYVADGLASKQIAHKLNISDNTVIVHIKNMRRKTNSKNVAELIGKAIREGWI